MSKQRGQATLQLPTLFEVGRAVASIGRYHFGIPTEGLYVSSWTGGTDAPYLSARAPLREGQVYVDSLANWLLWLAGQEPPPGGISALLKRLESLPRWARLLLALNYVPVKVRVPTPGGPMTYSPHGVVVLLGHFGPSASLELETWSCSTSHDVVGADVGAMPNTIGATALEAIFDAWSQVIVSNAGFSFSTETWLDGVAYYRRQGDGRSSTGTWERYIAPTPAQGAATAGTAGHPYQIATVVSEDAGGARRGRFGRFYMPGLAMPLVSGVWLASAIDTFAETVAERLGDVNSALNVAVGDETELVVASAIGEGENRPVRRLAVGVVPDTQRRRRRNLQENYQEVPFQTIP